jgi:16S rRNA (guanine527-N7)-methyltransferase
MPTLTTSRIAELLVPFYHDPPSELLDQLSVYLDLLLKWNARTNLTSIRDPEEIVRRHFGESLFTAAHLPACKTLLDLGSGAGFPGIPIQLALPQLKVTLAESQNKKAAFLQEAVRTLGLQTRVWPDRAENLSPGSCFDVVTLRAVDDPESALKTAVTLICADGCIAHLTSSGHTTGVVIPFPGTGRTVLHLLPRLL